jgi:peptidoglycan/xylan/chitin deacetylase (PgdA/CDA1 family)
MIRTSLAVAAALFAAFTSKTAENTKPEKKAAPKPAPAVVAPAAPVAPATAPASKEQIKYSQCHVDGPFIAMTFDDGPHGSQTPRLLKMLKERNIHATFFVLGQCVAQNPEIAKQIVEEGHEIANHSWSHPILSKMAEGSVRDQLQRTHDVVKQTTGVNMTLMRPPYGAFTANQVSFSHGTWGYKCILWDVDSLDWQHRNPAKTESIIMGTTHPGSIVLCHDIHKTTIDAMEKTLDGLIKKGFRFVTVSELIAMNKEGGATKPKTAATLTPADAKNVATSLDEIAKPEVAR